MPFVKLKNPIGLHGRVLSSGISEVTEEQLKTIQSNCKNIVEDFGDHLNESKTVQEEQTPDSKEKGVDPLNPEGDKPPVAETKPPVQNQGQAPAQNQAQAPAQAPSNQNKPANPKNQGQAQG
jgi:hypothetical protein